MFTVDDQNMAQHVTVVDRSLLSASSYASDVAESQHRCAKPNSISQFIYARLDVVAQHCRYQRYEFVRFVLIKPFIRVVH
jgi:hypothetical protein